MQHMSTTWTALRAAYFTGRSGAPILQVPDEELQSRVHNMIAQHKKTYTWWQGQGQGQRSSERATTSFGGTQLR